MPQETTETLSKGSRVPGRVSNRGPRAIEAGVRLELVFIFHYKNDALKFTHP
jgi:hypothetical protein